MRIFISYARANEGRLPEITQALHAHEVWFDRKLGAGVEWWREIEQQIASAHCFLALVSADSEQSEFCGKELAIARRLEKAVVPVLIDDHPIPEGLADNQAIDLSRGLNADTVATLLNGLFEIERQVFNPLRRAAEGGAAHEVLSRLTLVSASDRKRRTYEAFLDSEITTVPLSIVELQDVDPHVVALDKVEKAYAVLRRPVIVEQSALAVRAWEDSPAPWRPHLRAPSGSTPCVACSRASTTVTSSRSRSRLSPTARSGAASSGRCRAGSRPSRGATRGPYGIRS